MSDFLDKAIMAHNLWKGRLRASLSGGALPDEEMVRRDDACDLGKWIHGEGRQCQEMLEYKEILSAHARFHQAAGDVIKLVKASKTLEAAQELDKGEFTIASVGVMLALEKLRQTRVV